jgi:LppP/LprE lipoprotein
MDSFKLRRTFSNRHISAHAVIERSGRPRLEATRSARGRTVAVIAAAVAFTAISACDSTRTQAPSARPTVPVWSLTPTSSANPGGAETTPGFSYVAVAKKIAEQGFAIVAGPRAAGSPGPLRAFIVICSGSADGKCGGIEFFYNDKYAGRMTVGHRGNLVMYLYNARIVTQDGRTIVLDLPMSRPNDPLCCPSGGTLVTHYAWNGQAVVPVGFTARFAPRPKLQP